MYPVDSLGQGLPSADDREFEALKKDMQEVDDCVKLIKAMVVLCRHLAPALREELMATGKPVLWSIMSRFRPEQRDELEKLPAGARLPAVILAAQLLIVEIAKGVVTEGVPHD